MMRVQHGKMKGTNVFRDIVVLCFVINLLYVDVVHYKNFCRFISLVSLNI